jgi:uncharacterized protein (TIGR00297 family)
VSPAARLVVALACASLIAWAAHRRSSLSGSGAAGAVIVGTVVLGCGGWVWGAVLVIFFVLSSMLSRYRASTKQHLAEKFAKGSRRDLGQVLANGGVGTVLAMAWAWQPQPIFLAAYIGALATVTADTWATELGVLSPRPPRLITTWRPVPVGTSGGVSVLGTTATVAGALTIGVSVATLHGLEQALGGGVHIAALLVLVPIAVVSGIAGSLFDSLLGATVQAMYHSASRAKETEKRIDPDGSANQLVRGWSWLGNDAVNLLSSVLGAWVAAALWHWWG